MVTITKTGEWTKRPVDRRIFGQFIESGFGRQVSGLWSEMLYNRAFREIPPYRYPTWAWLGLDQAHYNSDAPFWHSGYEECNWQPVGAPTLQRQLGHHTYKGMSALLVQKNGDSPCGLCQEGIRLVAGREYRFTLTACVRGSIGEAGLAGFGVTKHSDEAFPLNVAIGAQTASFLLTTVTRRQEWVFVAKETETAKATLTFSWDGGVILSCASLMPTDQVSGWRRDAVETLRRIAPPVVRFPGGCFVSFFDWRASVGERDTREPVPSYYWGGLEENDVGVDEFMRLSELLSFEPQFCINMMTSSPFDARQLVEYLTAPAEIGAGRMRALNGHEAPYRARLFEMDNEPSRKWTAIQYAEQCVAFAKEMRLAQPDIELMMACYEYPLEALAPMLAIAGKHIGYVIYRQGWPEFAQKVLPILRAYNEQNGADVRLVNTEWLPSCASVEPYRDQEIPTDFHWRGEIVNDTRKILSTQQRNWNYALNGAKRLMEYMSYGGAFALANFNNLCNTWGQNVMEATKETCYLSLMGEVFAFFNAHFTPCFAAATESGDQVSAQLTRGVDGIERLYLINHASSEREVRLPTGDWRCLGALTADDRGACARADTRVARDCVVPIENGVARLPGLTLCCLEKNK